MELPLVRCSGANRTCRAAPDRRWCRHCGWPRSREWSSGSRCRRWPAGWRGVLGLVMKVSGESGATAVMTTGSMSKAGASLGAGEDGGQGRQRQGAGNSETRVLHDGASLSLHVGRRARADAARAGRGPGMRRKAAKAGAGYGGRKSARGARGSCDQARTGQAGRAAPAAGRPRAAAAATAAQAARPRPRRRRARQAVGAAAAGPGSGAPPSRTAFLGGVIGLAGVFAVVRTRHRGHAGHGRGWRARVHQRRHHAGRTAGGRAEADLQAALAQRGGVRHVADRHQRAQHGRQRRAGTARSVRAIPWRACDGGLTCVAFYLIRGCGRRSRAGRACAASWRTRRRAARYSHATRGRPACRTSRRIQTGSHAQ